MPIEDEQRWHWGEGTKYATEAMKSLFALNGGSAVAILAFWGPARSTIDKTSHVVASQQIGKALFAFGIGALLAVGTFICAYLAQLAYGNSPPMSDRIVSKKAIISHYVAYAMLVGSIAFFCRGIWKASLVLGQI